MAGLKEKSSAAPVRTGGGFELRLERGGAFIRLADQPIGAGLKLESLTLQISDVKFPFDVGLGSGQFRHRLSDLVEMTVSADPSAADAPLAAAGLAAFGIEDVRIAARESFLEIAGRLVGGPAFALEAGLLPAGEQGVTFVFHSPRILGPSPVPAAALPHLARTVIDAVGREAVPPDPLVPILRRILAPRGWKLPRTAEVRVAQAAIASGTVRISWDRDGAHPSVAPADPSLLSAEEGARTFRDAEALVARGDYSGAREAYLAAGPAASSHPFAVEQLLSLLTLEDRSQDEALDLAADWLSRRPGFAPALATEAQVRLMRGENVRAARALAALAAAALERGALFLALSAAEAAFSLPDASREDALRAVETALQVRRDHVPALRAMRSLAREGGDREALLRANRRLVAHEVEDADRARAHAELGDLLLEADPPGARLHLDQALRLAPDDVGALASLSRACTSAGEHLRAVRALDRLRELLLTRGDKAGAARAALDSGAIWEEHLSNSENALLRYREACELAPSADAHARAARAAEAAGQWAEAGDHQAAVLASLDPSAPGAAELAVRTRIALADMADRRLGDPAAAAAHLAAAAALAPEDAALQRRVLSVERALGRTAGVLTTLDRLVVLEGDPAQRALLLAEAGEAAATLGRPSDARGRFTAAIAADASCRPALSGLVRLAQERGDAVAERDALERLAPLAAPGEESAAILDRLVEARERSGDLAGALDAARKANAAAPAGPRLDVALRLARRSGDGSALAALLADQARGAAAAGDSALATDAWLERSRLLAMERPADALAALEEARRVSPGEARVLRAQIDLAERTGDSRLALSCLRALLAGSPEDAPALDLRAAKAALAAGEPAAAREHAERAVERKVEGAAEVLDEILDLTGDDATRAEVMLRLGRTLEAARLFERNGDAMRALAALERAAADPSLAPQALPRISDARLAAGDRIGAAAALLDLARITRGREGARTALRANALGRGADALDVAIELDPRFAPARARRAALRAGDDPRAALEDAEAALDGDELPEEERIDVLTLAARTAAAAGDGAAARRHLATYCEAAPHDDDALGRLAALQRASGARADLARTLEKRLESAPPSDATAIRLELSDLLVAADPARAARLALDALDLDPGSLTALRAVTSPPRSSHVPAADRIGLLARLAAKAGAGPAEAAAALAARARLLAEEGDARGALDAALEAARMAPDADEPMELRAELAVRLGDAAEAARALLARAARARDRAEPYAAERLAEAGLAALAAGVPGGEAALRYALVAKPERETARAVLEALVKLSRDHGDSTGERDCLTSLVPLLPTGARPEALLRLSSFAMAANDPSGAREAAEKARALAPRDRSAVEACHAAAKAQGDLAGQAELLAQLASLDPASAGQRHLERARILEGLGSAKEADAAYAAALAALPPDRNLADEHARLRRDAPGVSGASEPLEAFALRTTITRESALALRAAAALAVQEDDTGAALRCARRAHARTQDDPAFAGPLLARLLYLHGSGAEALVLHRRLLETDLTGVSREDAVTICRQAADLAEDAGEKALCFGALDRLLGLRPQDMDAALRRFALDRDRKRAVRALSAAAETCRSRARRAPALALAAEAALQEIQDRDLGERLFRMAREDLSRDPRAAADLARRYARTIRETEGRSSRPYLAALHDASAAAQATGDRAAARDLLEEAIALERESGLFADAARDMLQLDALAVAEGDFAESAARMRAAGSLLREAGDLAGAADALRQAYAANPESEETFRLVEEVARELGPDGAPLLAEVLSDRVARAPADDRGASGPSLDDNGAIFASVETPAAATPLPAPDAGESGFPEGFIFEPGGGPESSLPEVDLSDLAVDGEAPAAYLPDLAAGDAPAGEMPVDAGLDQGGGSTAGSELGVEGARGMLERASRSGAREERLALRREAARALSRSEDSSDRALAADAWTAVAAEAQDDLEAAREASALLLGLDRREDAIPHLAALVRADPDDEEAARELAQAYSERHRERAELFLSRAEHGEGAARAARLREAARALFAAGDDTRARSALSGAFDAWPADGAAFAGVLRDSAADVERTDAILLARAAAVPEEAAACHRARADALQAFGFSERAVEAYEAALAAEPDDVATLAALASCLADARGEDAAQRIDARIVLRAEQSPGDVSGSVEASSRYRLGLAWYLAGRAAECVADLDRALLLAPGDARAGLAFAALAEGHAARGDAAAALAAARARVERASALGLLDEERDASQAEKDLAERLGVPVPPHETALDAVAPPTSFEDLESQFDAGEPDLLAASPEGPATATPGETSLGEPPSNEPLPGEIDPRATARDAAERALVETEPADRAAAWIASAEALVRASAPADEVRTALDLACESDSDSPDPWRARARVESALGDPVAAARAYLAVAIRSDGDDAARAALEAARLFADAGSHGDCARAYRVAQHAKPGSIPQGMVIAEEALAAGDAGTAVEHLLAVPPHEVPAEIRPSHARTLARALDAASHPYAERAWTDIFHGTPEDGEAFERAAALARARAGVEAWIDIAAEHEKSLAGPGDTDRRRDLRYARGAVFLEEGQLEAARGAFLAALELDPAHGPALDALAALDARKDEWAEAAARLGAEAAAAVDAAESAALYLRLARILRDRLDDMAGAIAAARAAMALGKTSHAPAARRSAEEAQALIEELGGAAISQALEPAPPEEDGVAAVLRARAASAEDEQRVDLLEHLADHLDRAGDQAGAQEARSAALAPDGGAQLDHRAAPAEQTALGDVPGVPAAEQESPLEKIAFGDSPGFEDDLVAEIAAAFDGVPAAPDAEQEPRSEPIAFGDAPHGPGAEHDPFAERVAFRTAPQVPQADHDALAEPFAFGDAPPEPRSDHDDVPEAVAFGDAPQVPQSNHDAFAEQFAFGDAPAQGAPDLAGEGRACVQAGDLVGGYDLLSRALAAEPSDLTIARDLSSLAERLGRFEAHVHLGERCADALAAYDSPSAAAEYRRLAEVIRTRIGDQDRAAVMLEKALSLVPDDAEARRQLAAAWAARPESAPRALEAWLEIARREPADGEALACLAASCESLASSADARESARASERAFLAASLAAFASSGRAVPDEAPAARLAPSIPVDARARVAVPGSAGPLARLLRLLAPWLETLFPADLGRRGASVENRLEFGQAPALASAFENAARALGSRRHGVFLTSRQGFDASLENTQPPAIVLSAGIATLPEQCLPFLAARTLYLLDQGTALVGKFAPKDVAILLELACRFAGGAPPPLGLPAERAGSFLAVLETQVPDEARRTARELGKAAAQELADIDPRALGAALRRTANRVALLYAGDPGAALHALAFLDPRLGGAAGAAQALALPDLRDLALFALSDPFLELRASVRA